MSVGGIRYGTEIVIQWWCVGVHNFIFIFLLLIPGLEGQVKTNKKIKKTKKEQLKRNNYIIHNFIK